YFGGRCMRDAGDELGITVVYDNYPDKEGLETGWGFCAYIRGGEKNVLFDTGPAGWVLRNMKELAIEPEYEGAGDRAGRH
ncbi:MAG: hypothetical protein ACYTEX_23590, partial [Planctomycetota bacterium]